MRHSTTRQPPAVLSMGPSVQREMSSLIREVKHEIEMQDRNSLLVLKFSEKECLEIRNFIPVIHAVYRLVTFILIPNSISKMRMIFFISIDR